MRVSKSVNTQPWYRRLRSSQHFLPLLLGVGLVLLRFAPMFLGKTVLFGDNFSLMIPGKLFTVHWLLQGVLPLWNPLLFAGIPWIGDINQSVLYPSTVLFLLPSAGWALNLDILLHQLFTLIGVYILCWRFSKKTGPALLGALLWTFAPQLTGSLNNLSTFQTMAWTPWVVLAGMGVARNRTWTFWVIPMLLTLQLAAGYPQHVLYSALTAVLINAWLCRSQLTSPQGIIKWCVHWLAIGTTTIALSSVLWIPFLPVVKDSTRSIQTLKQGASGSLHPEDLVKVVFPYIFDQPAEGMKWGPSWNRTPNVFLYLTWFGLGVIGLGLWSRRFAQTDWFLLIVSGLGIVYAFGQYLPGFTLLQQLPLLRQSRGISIILLIPTLLLAILVARQTAKTTFEANRKLWTGAGILCIGLGATALIGYATSQYYFASIWYQLDGLLQGTLAASSFHTLPRDTIIASLFARNLLVVSMTTGWAILALRFQKTAILVCIIGLELIYFSGAHYRFGPVGIYDFSTAEKTARPLVDLADFQQYRLLTRNYNAPYSDFGFYNDSFSVRKPFSDSFIDASELADYQHLQRMRDGFTPDWNVAAGVPVIHGYTTLLPQSLHEVFWNNKDDPWINNLPHIATTDPGLKQWATRYYLVDTWFPDYGEQFPSKLLGAKDHWKLFEIPGVLSRFRFANDEPVVLNDFLETPNQISFTSINERNQAKLIIADRYDQDWRAVVNGKPVPVENSKGMRAVVIPAGHFTMKMWYQPRWFYWGLVISTVTWLGLCLVAAGQYVSTHHNAGRPIGLISKRTRLSAKGINPKKQRRQRQ